MSFSVGRIRLLQHVVALFSVFLISSVLYVFLISSGLYDFISHRQIRPPYAGEYIANVAKGKTAVANLVALNSALAFGKTLVLFGSSELTSWDLAYIPYHFLPKSLNIPVLAYGHANFQSFGIDGILRANADALSARTKLVIMVSPGWFKQRMSLDSFIEHFQPQILVPLYQDKIAKDAIGRYVKQHLAEFKTISEYQRAFIADPVEKQRTHFDLKMRLAFIKEQFDVFETRALVLFVDWLLHPRQTTTPILPSEAQWKAYESQAGAEEISHMKGNQHWVRDNYYRKYLSDLPADGAEYFPRSLDVAPEFARLTELLRFLNEKNVHALVVMQPLNPFVYKDANRIRPVAQRLAALCKQTGMQYFDMADKDYTPGTMRDGMHLGELGWAWVDRQILRYMASQ